MDLPTFGDLKAESSLVQPLENNIEVLQTLKHRKQKKKEKVTIKRKKIDLTGDVAVLPLGLYS